MHFNGKMSRRIPNLVHRHTIVPAVVRQRHVRNVQLRSQPSQLNADIAAVGLDRAAILEPLDGCRGVGIRHIALQGQGRVYSHGYGDRVASMVLPDYVRYYCIDKKKWIKDGLYDR